MIDHHALHYHAPRMSEMKKVFWAHSVGAFGVSLVMVFIPIFLLGLTNFLRLLAQSGAHVLGLNLLSDIGRSLYQTPFMSRYYEHADNAPRHEYIAAMEGAFSIATTFFFGFLLALLVLNVSTHVILLIGLAIAVPASYGMRSIR